MELDLIHATDVEILIKRRRGKRAALLGWESRGGYSAGEQSEGDSVAKCIPRGDGLGDGAGLDSAWNSNDQHKTVTNNQLCHSILSSQDTGNVFTVDSPSLGAANPRALGQEGLPCIKKNQFPHFITWLSERRGKKCCRIVHKILTHRSASEP